MATSPTEKLMKIIQEGQTQMLDYLRRADERGERQSRATLKALAAIQEGQKVLHDGQKTLAAGQKTIAQILEHVVQTTERIVQTADRTERMVADVAFMANEARREAKEAKERVLDITAGTRKN